VTSNCLTCARRQEVTICRGFPQPQAAESRPADGNTGRVVQKTSPNKSHPPLSSNSAGTSSVPGSRYFGESDADPSASSVARAGEACNNTPGKQHMQRQVHISEISTNKERQDRKQIDYKRGTIEMGCERDRKAKHEKTKSTATRLRNEKRKGDTKLRKTPQGLEALNCCFEG
jgi:hypothetical protein